LPRGKIVDSQGNARFYDAQHSPPRQRLLKHCHEVDWNAVQIKVAVSDAIKRTTKIIDGPGDPRCVMADVVW
jgi:hypothetical protein